MLPLLTWATCAALQPSSFALLERRHAQNPSSSMLRRASVQHVALGAFVRAAGVPMRASVPSASAISSQQGSIYENTRGRVLIVGGTGYLGREICREALKRGWSVVSLSRRGANPLPNDVELQQVDCCGGLRAEGAEQRRAAAAGAEVLERGRRADDGARLA